MNERLDNAPAAPAGGRRLWLTVFAAAATLLLLTAQRGPAWQDSGVFQWRIHTFDLTGRLGLALAHPLLILLGQLARAIPIGTEIWRLNALSAIAAAVAAANVALLVRRLAPKVPAAAYLAAGAFTLGHTVWWLATVTESHALLAAIISGELLVLTALLRRPRISMVLLMGVLNGLGMATHNLALLALPAYGLAVVLPAVRGRLKWWAVPLFVAAWAAGASPLLLLVARQAARTGLAAAAQSALFGHAWQGAVLGSGLSLIPYGLGYIAYSFPNLTLPLAAVGLWRLRRRAGAPLAAALTYILAVHFVFAIRYRVSDQFMFFVPFYLVASLLAGLGLAELAAKRRWLATAALCSLALGPLLYGVMPRVVRSAGVRLPGSRRPLPFRDHARYWLTPWKHTEDSAARFASEALAQLERAGGAHVLIGDSTTYWPLQWIAGVRRPDAQVRVMGGGSAAALPERWHSDPAGTLREAEAAGRAVWVASNAKGYCPNELLPYVDAEATGLLYRVRAPAE